MFHESQTLLNPDMLKGIQILVVDNDADNRYLHELLFETYGAQVTSLESIAEAMTRLEYLTPDILVCETRFFNEDVSPLIQRIKSMALGREREIPILAVSAYCSNSFAQNWLAMVEDFLFKPTDIDQLVNEVWDLVHLAKLAQKVNIKDWIEEYRVWTNHQVTAAPSSTDKTSGIAAFA